MLLGVIAAASEAMSQTRSRKAKAEIIAGVLDQCPVAELETVIGFLSGTPKQGKVGIGWSAVSNLTSTPSDAMSLPVADVDAFLDEYPSVTGAGSQELRAARLSALMRQATAAEAGFLRGLLTGELRQGALEGVVVDGIAMAFSVPAAAVRRAAMLTGDLGQAGRLAATKGLAGLDAVGMIVLTAVQPMLASSAPDVESALSGLGRAAIEWKLDGTRIQVHRHGETVRVFTRNLNDVTDRVPHIVDRVMSMPVESVVLDGESMLLGADDGPMPFEETMSQFGTDGGGGMELHPFWFDVLHLDGDDLIDLPLTQRRAELVRIASEREVIPQIITQDPAEAQAFLDDARARRHEGVMVKGLDGVYEAGRRGATWIKVKPVYTLDLVILAAEWGSGRRQGWLSNLHLGARDPDGGFVMLGKTFKGLTDKMLEFQTRALLDLEERRTARTVFVRPELVVEIAFDGLLPSTRYPGGLALRFARVRAHRPDKNPEDADTIDTVREIFESRRSPIVGES